MAATANGTSCGPGRDSRRLRLYGASVSNWDLVLAYTEEYATWLGERGHPHPPVRAGNRLPAPAEVLAVLAALPGADLEVAGRDALVLPRGGGTGGYELMVQAPPGTSWDVDAWDEAGSFTVKGNRE